MVKTETHYIALYSQTFRENDKKSYALQPFPAQRIEFKYFQNTIVGAIILNMMKISNDLQGSMNHF